VRSLYGITAAQPASLNPIRPLRREDHVHCFPVPIAPPLLEHGWQQGRPRRWHLPLRRRNLRPRRFRSPEGSNQRRRAKAFNSPAFQSCRAPYPRACVCISADPRDSVECVCASWPNPSAFQTRDGAALRRPASSQAAPAKADALGTSAPGVHIDICNQVGLQMPKLWEAVRLSRLMGALPGCASSIPPWSSTSQE
jgi:hypothetical protein